MEYETDDDVAVSPPRSSYSLILVEIVPEPEQQPQELQPQEQQPMVVMEDTKPTSIRKEFNGYLIFIFS